MTPADTFPHASNLSRQKQVDHTGTRPLPGRATGPMVVEIYRNLPHLDCRAA